MTDSSLVSSHVPPPRRQSRLPSDAALYFNRVAFLFVPNVCNARCEFCYVAPGFAESARLPEEMLARGTSLFDALRTWGFEEVRVTGGEPLLFDNAAELFQRISSAGLRYRVLTNGLRLRAFLPSARRNPPMQFTVSIHSLERIAEIYRVPVDVDAFMAAVKAATMISPVECTLVVEQDDEAAFFDETVTRLRASGVAGIKVIIANVAGASDRADHFRQLTDELRARWADAFSSFRVSDLDECSCRLRLKGFLSVELSSIRAYPCCVEVGTDPSALGGHFAQLGTGSPPRVDVTEDGRRLVHLAIAGSRTESLPCDAHYGACPIALRS